MNKPKCVKTPRFIYFYRTPMIFYEEADFYFRFKLMKQSAIKFLLLVFVITGVCALLQTLWNRQMPEKMHLQNGFLLLGIFAVSVSAIHLFLLSSTGGEPQAFIRKFLGVTVFKFMFYIFLIIVFLLFSTENKQALILHFLFYYAVFTVLEVSMLYGEMQKGKK